MARVYTQAQKITMHSKRQKIQIKSHLNIFRPRLQKAKIQQVKLYFWYEPIKKMQTVCIFIFENCLLSFSASHESFSYEKSCTTSGHDKYLK